MSSRPIDPPVMGASSAILDRERPPDVPEGRLAELAARVPRLPREPGVYLFRDGRGRVVYVGKAKSLRDRVRSYFQESGDGRAQIRFLMRRVADLEVVVTATEKEALILEDTLIKKHRPRYNIRLRDDKTYTSLRIDQRHPFPRVTVERRPSREGAIVLGPYASAQAVRRTVKDLHQLFPLRTCSDSDLANRSRPCLDHQIGRCLAPCVGLIAEDEYARLVDGAVAFLKGRNRDVVALLGERMRRAAAALDFEQAARIRDRIAMIEATLERQRVVREGQGDQEIVAVVVEGTRVQAAVLRVRDGVLIETESFPLTGGGEGDEDPLAAFLERRYLGLEDLPDEIVVPRDVESRVLLEEGLGERRGRRVRIVVPQRGERRRLVEMAERNARTAIETATDPEAERRAVLARARTKLELEQTPRRIECVDLSHLGGTGAVGSLVRFEDAGPASAGYRRFRIRTRSHPDDYGMMHEVLSRRFRPERDTAGDPDLLLVDGGKGQLNIAVAVLSEVGVEGVEIASIAKDPDRIFRPGRSNPIALREGDPVLRLLGRVRDEAHRFAITYQRQVRSRERVRSRLDDLEGIGPGRRRALLRHFGSVAALERATPADIASVPGFGAALAARVHGFLTGSDVAVVADGDPPAPHEAQGPVSDAAPTGSIAPVVADGADGARADRDEADGREEPSAPGPGEPRDTGAPRG